MKKQDVKLTKEQIIENAIQRFDFYQKKEAEIEGIDFLIFQLLSEFSRKQTPKTLEDKKFINEINKYRDNIKEYSYGAYLVKIEIQEIFGIELQEDKL